MSKPDSEMGDIPVCNCGAGLYPSERDTGMCMRCFLDMHDNRIDDEREEDDAA